MSGARVLLVAPAFHGYGRSIAAALERAGHEVVLHEYDLNPTTMRKLEHKLVHELRDRVFDDDGGARRHARAMTRRSVEAVSRARADVVVTVKGDVLGVEYWQELDRSGARQLLWLYDELSRMRFDDEVLASRPSIVSYSPGDVAALAQPGLASGARAGRVRPHDSVRARPIVRDRLRGSAIPGP